MVKTRLRITVVPSSSRNRIAGWLGDTLKIRVTAPAEGGKANAAVEAAIADALGLANGAARVIAGWTSPRKVIEIDGVSESDLDRRLPKIGG